MQKTVVDTVIETAMVETMRQTKKRAATRQVGIRLPVELIEQLNSYVLRRNQAEPGLELSLSDAVRLLLVPALAGANK